MTATEAHRRTLYRMARIEQAKGNHAEARRLDMRVIELARQEANR